MVADYKIRRIALVGYFKKKMKGEAEILDYKDNSRLIDNVRL